MRSGAESAWPPTAGNSANNAGKRLNHVSLQDAVRLHSCITPIILPIRRAVGDEEDKRDEAATVEGFLTFVEVSVRISRHCNAYEVTA